MMKLPAFLLLFLSFLGTAAAQKNNTTTTAPAKGYPIQPVNFTAVKLTDNFWAPRLETNQKVTLDYTFGQCEQTGRVKNFDYASGAQAGKFCTKYAFDDSDVYKIIEGAAYSLSVRKNPRLEKYVDSLITKIGAAQEPDGYLYTWGTIHEREKAAGSATNPTTGSFHLGSDQRWTREDQHSHELYNLGHLYEAAVAWYYATGKRNLLDISLKSAELVYKNFGWGKLQKATGHQEIELGLVKLYLVTKDKRWLDLAKFFLDVRGYGDQYNQNHQKAKDQREVVGHAVRACYMYAAMADVTALSGDTSYMPALNALWQDMVGRKMYVTGGIGSAGDNEGFTTPYDLPNYSAYCETCSSIAFIFWNHRMFLLTGDSKYMDVLEKTLYNAAAAGTSLSGDRFFYPNPLEARKNVERSPWFSCACCPSNVARFMPSIPEYVYAKRDNDLYVNLFVNSETTIENRNSKGEYVAVKIAQQSNYPWDGRIRITVDPAKPNTMTLKIRIPGWARGDASPLDLYSYKDHPGGNIYLKINGQEVRDVVKNGYATINRKWNKGDVVEVEFPMPVRLVTAIQAVAEDQGKCAVQRGPLMYCLEGKDQADERVLSLLVNPDEVTFEHKFEPKLLNGVETLSFKGFMMKSRTEQMPVNLKAIPYYAWANRGKDNMVMWLPYEPGVSRPLAAPTVANKSTVTASEGVQGDLNAVNDQYLPSKSHDKSNPFIHWWPLFGSTSWLQYDFGKAEQVGTARIYWLDDEATGGGCRVPASFRVLYKEGEEWKPVYSYEGFKVVKDGWSEVQFEPVKTSALRVEFTSQPNVSSGVHEWEVK